MCVGSVGMTSAASAKSQTVAVGAGQPALAGRCSSRRRPPLLSDRVVVAASRRRRLGAARRRRGRPAARIIVRSGSSSAASASARSSVARRRGGLADSEHRLAARSGRAPVARRCRPAGRWRCSTSVRTLVQPLDRRLRSARRICSAWRSAAAEHLLGALRRVARWPVRPACAPAPRPRRRSCRPAPGRGRAAAWPAHGRARPPGAARRPRGRPGPGPSRRRPSASARTRLGDLSRPPAGSSAISWPTRLNASAAGGRMAGRCAGPTPDAPGSRSCDRVTRYRRGHLRQERVDLDHVVAAGRPRGTHGPRCRRASAPQFASVGPSPSGPDRLGTGAHRIAWRRSFGPP